MADDDATLFQRQSASDLLWGMSHRKAFAHVVPQVRLACQFEAAIPLPPALGQLLSPDWLVNSRPNPRGAGGAPPFPPERRRRPAERRSHLGLRFTPRM